MKQTQIVYDPECPVCDFYCKRCEIAETQGTLVRIDARQSSQIMQEITAAGLDIDAGMVLKTDDGVYYGSDAINRLALMSSRKGFVNRMGYWLFRSPRIANVLYPILAACRNLLLKLLGRTRINNLGIDNNDKF